MWQSYSSLEAILVGLLLPDVYFWSRAVYLTRPPRPIPNIVFVDNRIPNDIDRSRCT
jgi:hypothetical protein